jgi:starch synthase
MLKVLFAASEVAPIAKVGGLGDVAGALPKALKKLGIDVRIIMPKYRSINPVSHLPGSDIPVYYVSSEEFFERDQIYGYADDPDRFAYFCKGLLELTEQVGFRPDVIHINDYHTSLVPAILEVGNKGAGFFSKVKTLLTIHNLANQGNHDIHVLANAGLSWNSTPELGEDARDKDIDMLRDGVEAADMIVAVSPTYSKEILTSEYGEGLESTLVARKSDLYGVLNGIDTEVYDPATDHNIASNYSFDLAEKRFGNREALVRDMKILRPEWPIVGMISRLVGQKGFDLVLEASEELARANANFVVLGVGEKRFEDALRGLSERLGSNFYVNLEFSEVKSRKIYAGSDFFLIPSRFEPCGLTQMVSMRYGSVPIVRKTGGLADTVWEGKNGFVFERYDAREMVEAIEGALRMYKNKELIRKLQSEGMSENFSWDKSARDYIKLYEKDVEESGGS